MNYSCFNGCAPGCDCKPSTPPQARVAKVGKRVDVSRVQLDSMTPSVRRGVWPQLARRVAQWVGALAVVAIWMLACAATEHSSNTTRTDSGPDQHQGVQKTKVTA